MQPTTRLTPTRRLAPRYLVFGLLAGGAAPILAAAILAAAPARPASGRLPVPRESFVANRGQWDTAARFVARRAGMQLRLEPGAIVLQLEDSRDEGCREGTVVRFVFEGARDGAPLEGIGRAASRSHYLLGNDASRWIAGVPRYEAVLYRGLYDGVDVRVRDEEGIPEYDLLLAPGAELEQVRIRVEGIEGARLQADGTLVMQTSLGEVRQAPPRAWYTLPSGERRPAGCRLQNLEDAEPAEDGAASFGFALEALRAPHALVVDPGITWSSYLGGSLDDEILGMVLDTSTGEVVVSGRTWSADFPSQPGAYQASLGGGSDAFVARWSADGSHLLWSTYLGGSGDDAALAALGAGASGDVTVAGETASADFPVTAGAFDTSLGGSTDAFVARLDASGSTLLWSTYLGGDLAGDRVLGLALDPLGSGDVALAGATSAEDFPATEGSFDITYNGGASDGFLSWLRADGAALTWSMFLGGSAADQAVALVLDVTTADVAVTGFTDSADFPVTFGSFDQSFNGIRDGFLSRVDSAGQMVTQSTFLGGTGTDEITDLVMDQWGSIMVTGWTDSADWPVTSGVLGPARLGPTDAMVTRLNSSLGAPLIFSTYLGGTGDEKASGITQTTGGEPVLVGQTTSADFPTSAAAYDTTYNGGGTEGDAFVTRLNVKMDAPLYSTYLGGTGDDAAMRGAVLGFGPPGDTLVAGHTASIDFPATPGALGTSHQGGTRDAFVSRVCVESCPFLGSTSAYGSGTAGTGGVPALTAPAPRIGDGSFAVQLANARPGAPVSWLLGPTSLSMPLGAYGATLLVAPTAIVPGAADGQGGAVLPLPAPCSAILCGFPLFVQVLVLDPQAQGGVAFSGGLRAQFGN